VNNVKLSTTGKILLGVAVGIPIVGVLFYYGLARARREKYLVLTCGEHGVIDPAPGTYTFNAGASVAIKASPDAGYEANWQLAGIDVEKGVNEYSVVMHSDLTVNVYFTLKDGTPGVITGIRPVGSIVTYQNFRFWYGNPFANIDIAECNENWEDGETQPSTLTFKVHDGADRGVPGINVRVSPQLNPDGTPYKGIMLFNGIAYSHSTPYESITDEQGLVKIPVRTIYGVDDINLDGGGIELSRGTGLYADKMTFPGPFPSVKRVLPVYHGLAAGIGWMWSGNGGGGTISYNRLVDAIIIGTDKSCLASVGVAFGVVWKA